MYDGLTATYSFSCPATAGRVRVRLSAFRALERLPGAAHPSVYDVVFSCPCGERHEALVGHDELDWAPLQPVETPFYNVMTGRLEAADTEFGDQVAGHLRRGRWPWCFFCYQEEQPRPAYPSALRVLQPDGRSVAVAARCQACGQTSVNVVSAEHLDVPFYSDREVAVVERRYPADVGLDELVGELRRAVHGATLRRLAA
jgi:hypothetical protein